MLNEAVRNVPKNNVLDLVCLRFDFITMDQSYCYSASIHNILVFYLSTPAKRE